MQFKYIKLFCLISLMAFSSSAMATCFVDAPLDCQGSAAGLSWIPRSLKNRSTLYYSDDVQKSQNGCTNFAKIIKTECSISMPVSVQFYPNDNSNAEKISNFITGNYSTLKNDLTWTKSFDDYFNNTQLNSLNNTASSAALKSVQSAVLEFSNPTGNSQSLTIRTPCNLSSTHSTFKSSYEDFISSGGCSYSYSCQTEDTAGNGVGERLVITKMPQPKSFLYFCSQDNAISLISSILTKANADANLAGTTGKLGKLNFTQFNIPYMASSDKTIISYVNKQKSKSFSNLNHLSLPLALSSVGQALKGLELYNTTNTIFDTTTTTNDYAEAVVKFCSGSSAKVFECLDPSSKDTKTQISVLKQNPSLSSQFSNARFFGYINQSVDSKLKKVSLLEGTYGKDVYTYLAKNIFKLIKGKTGVVILAADANSTSNDDTSTLLVFPVKGVSGKSILVIDNITTTTFSLDFNSKAYRLNKSSDSTKQFIPIGIFLADPWPVDVSSTRNNPAYQTALSTNLTNSAWLSNDSSTCNPISTGRVTINGKDYVFHNSGGSTTGDTKTIACRSLSIDGQSAFDFTGTISYSCNAGKITVSTNSCGDRVYAGSNLKTCDVQNGFGVQKLSVNSTTGEFSTSGATCVTRACNNGFSIQNNTCVDDHVTIGNIEGLIQENNKFYISGWTCTKYVDNALNINLYFSNSSGSLETYKSNQLANLVREAAVSTQCSTQKSAYGFKIEIPNSDLVRYYGKNLTIKANYNGTEYALNGSNFALADIFPPSANLSSIGSMYKSGSVLSFTISDIGGSGIKAAKCKIDSGNYGDCSLSSDKLSASYTIPSGISDGTHSLFVTVYDNANNPSLEVSKSFSVDNSGPVVTISNSSTGTSGKFEFSYSDGGSGMKSIECAIDGVTFSACTSPYTFSGLSSGDYVFKVRATDNLNNVSVASSSSWNIALSFDITQTNAVSGVIPVANLSAFSLSGTCTDNGSTITISVGSKSSTATCKSQIWSTSLNLASLSDGSYSLTSSVSSNGKSKTGSTFSVVVDQTAPSITGAPAPGDAFSRTGTISFAATDSGSGINSIACSLNSETSYSACKSDTTYAFVNLTPGSYTLRIKAVDKAGNSTIKQVSWDVNTSVTMDIPSQISNGSILSNNIGSFQVSGTCSDSNQNVIVKVGTTSASTVTCDASKKWVAYLNLTSYSDGILDFTASHTVNGKSATSSKQSYTKDSVAPSLKLNTLSGASGTMTFTQSTDTYKIDGTFDDKSVTIQQLGATSVNYNYANLTAGPHKVKFKAYDYAGNSSDWVEQTWTVVLTELSVSISIPDSDRFVKKSVISSYPIYGTCSQDSTVSLVIGSLSYTTSCTSNKWTKNIDVSGLSNGLYTLTASITAGGKTASSSANIVIDKSAPVVSVGSISGAKGTVTFTVNKTSETYDTDIVKTECSVNYGDFFDCRSPLSYDMGAVKAGSIRVKATDKVGNDATGISEWADRSSATSSSSSGSSTTTSGRGR